MSSSTNSSTTSSAGSADEATGMGLPADGAPTESFTEPLAPTDTFPLVETATASLDTTDADDADDAASEPATEPITEPLAASPVDPAAPTGAVWSASSVRDGMGEATAAGAAGPTATSPSTAGAGATATGPEAASARPQSGWTFNARHGWQPEEPEPRRRISTGTTIWGMLLLALGALAIAAGAGLRVDLQLAAIGVLGVLGIVLLLLAIRPHRGRMGRP
ncbi:hypothetical protein [Actinomyces timonensis]|uniref:hypothetical protein n=1 Tax=Actinomyces timonensis TaxID=1288391 RepID=UPI00030830E1|nr:hypothetical protein [Actinomyces timonensis]